MNINLGLTTTLKQSKFAAKPEGLGLIRPGLTSLKNDYRTEG